MRYLTLALFVLASANGAAQEPRLRERFAPPVLTTLEQLVDSARAADLPAEPLVLKALEGRSKGAAPERIVGAVRLLLDALASARRELGPRSTADELTAGALWIRTGGDAVDLEAFRRAGPNRPLGTAISVSAELLGRGFPKAEAATGTAQLLRANTSDAEFLAFRDRVENAVKGGSRFDQAVHREIAKLSGRTRRDQ